MNLYLKTDNSVYVLPASPLHSFHGPAVEHTTRKNSLEALTNPSGLSVVTIVLACLPPGEA